MLKISGKNRGCLIVLNIPQLREKINKTCANRPVSCVNGEVRTEFGSLKEPAYRCAAALGRRACPLSLAPLASSPFGSNGDDRRQRRKQGGAVGAVASRMRAAAKQTLGAATRAVSPKVTERARMLTIKYKHSDSIPPTKSLPIATRCPFRNGLALSGAYAPALPEGEPFGNGSQSDKFIKHKKTERIVQE